LPIRGSPAPPAAIPPGLLGRSRDTAITVSPALNSSPSSSTASRTLTLPTHVPLVDCRSTSRTFPGPVGTSLACGLDTLPSERGRSQPAPRPITSSGPISTLLPRSGPDPTVTHMGASPGGDPKASGGGSRKPPSDYRLPVATVTA